MSQIIGEVICVKCGHLNLNPMISYMDDEQTESLIYCEGCNGWVRWC